MAPNTNLGPTHFRLVLKLLLCETAPDKDNRAVLSVFCNRHTSYDVSQNGLVQTFLVDSTTLRHGVIIVPNQY